MLLDIIRAVLSEPGSPLGTDELAGLVLSRIPPERLAEALREAVSPLVMQERNKANKRFLQYAHRGSAPVTVPEPAQVQVQVPASGSGVPGGPLYASPRSALLVNAVLRMTITGRGNRAVSLGMAGVADIRYEIDVNARKGVTLLGRATIFDDILHEMASIQAARVSELPEESIRNYGGRLQDLYSQRAGRSDRPGLPAPA